MAPGIWWCNRGGVMLMKLSVDSRRVNSYLSLANKSYYIPSLATWEHILIIFISSPQILVSLSYIYTYLFFSFFYLFIFFFIWIGIIVLPPIIFETTTYYFWEFSGARVELWQCHGTPLACWVRGCSWRHSWGCSIICYQFNILYLKPVEARSLFSFFLFIYY